MPSQDLIHRLGDGQTGRIKQMGIFTLPERRDTPSAIAFVTLAQIQQKRLDTSSDSFFDQLLMSSCGTDFDARRQENSGRSIGKND